MNKLEYLRPFRESNELFDEHKPHKGRNKKKFNRRIGQRQSSDYERSGVSWTAGRTWNVQVLCITINQSVFSQIKFLSPLQSSSLRADAQRNSRELRQQKMNSKQLKWFWPNRETYPRFDGTKKCNNFMIFLPLHLCHQKKLPIRLYFGMQQKEWICMHRINFFLHCIRNHRTGFAKL